MHIVIKIFLKILNKLLNDKLIVLALAGLCPLLLACENDTLSAKSQAVSTLHAFTGSPTRLVWVQDLLDNKDVVAEGKHLALMGYDSEDGQGERAILSGPENFMRPLISPSGKQVLFSDFHQETVHVVDWSGENRHFLANGLGVAVWRDARTDIDWVYIARSPVSPSRGPTFRQLYRVQIHNPEVEELVWDKTVTGAAIQLSRDGRRFSAEIPWPDCAVVDLDQQVARRLGKGCWPALAPDNSYTFWIFDGAHRNLEMFDTRTGKQTRVSLTDAPGIDGSEVYHPRWSNHARFMVMTGPYTIKEGGNNIRGGGAGIEIYAGKFNKDYTQIDSWFRVSNNQRADFYPDMWVAEDADAYREIVQKAEVSVLVDEQQVKAAAWPLVNDNLLFAWDNVAAKNEWSSAAKRFCQTEVIPEGWAQFSFDYQMNLSKGWYLAGRLPEPDPDVYNVLSSLLIEFVVNFARQVELDNGRVLALGYEDKEQIIVEIDQGELVLEERKMGKSVQSFRLATLQAGQSHILLQIAPEELTISLNGKIKQSFLRENYSIIAWPINFGSSQPQNRFTSKTLLERVALYTEELNADEILQLSNMTKKQKTGPKRKPVVARAELLSASSIPLPEDIAPYRRGLVVNEYKIVEVLNGELADPIILVAHWAILGGETLPTAERKIGKIYELELDAFENRPELEGERVSMDSDNLLLPMYYDLEQE